MREPVILTWTIMAIVLAVVFMFVMKHYNRKLGKYMTISIMVLLLVSFGASYLVFRFLHENTHIIWVLRVVIIVLSSLYLWFMYSRPWVVRSKLKFAEDSFLVEFLFVLLAGVAVSIAMVSAPQVTKLIEYRIDVSSTIWDGPLYFILPFICLKLVDFSGQVPFKLVENPWVFPLEEVNPKDWPWRDLLQVNFQLRRSLLEEYNILSWDAQPWIEAPKEISVGKAFRLVVQERRSRRELSSIQDLGDEYDGTPQFVWIFSFKSIWYNPSTWFRKPRYINPDLSIRQNDIKKGDVIKARRIPGDGTKSAGLDYAGIDEDDSDKTVIIKR